MNFKDALDILEIDSKYDELTLQIINKRYRKMALKYHPDKNGNTEESNEHFKKINEAYTYLKRESKYFENDEDDSCHDSQSIYLNVLKNFIKSAMDGNYSDLIAKIVSRYKSILYFSDELLENVKQMVIQKYDNVEIYKLNPSINDLLHNNFYKLYVQEQLYLVPLWHKESYYDGSGCEIIAICEPDLPNDIKIDDDNNLIVNIDVYAYSDLPDMIINNQDISFDIGDESFSIPLSELYIRREQYYRLKGRGLVNVKKDLYDLSDKSDIIVKIIFI